MNIPKWIQGLTEEDCQFIKRFLLSSGSLKELAAQYGITYPTVRIRLNRLIEKINILDDDKEKSSFRKDVKVLVTDGKLDINVARSILQSYEKSISEKE